MRPVWTGDSEFGSHHVKVGNHHVQTEPQKKNGLTFHYTGWLIGILIMVHYNPYITLYNWEV